MQPIHFRCHREIHHLKRRGLQLDKFKSQMGRIGALEILLRIQRCSNRSGWHGESTTKAKEKDWQGARAGVLELQALTFGRLIHHWIRAHLSGWGRQGDLVDAPIHGGVGVVFLNLPYFGWTISPPLQWARTQSIHGKMKHLSLRMFWIRDAVQEGLIGPVFVSTQNMAADIFTKALDHHKVQKCVAMLGLTSVQRFGALL